MKNNFTKMAKRMVNKTTKAMKKNPKATVIAGAATVGCAGIGVTSIANALARKTIKRFARTGRLPKNIATSSTPAAMQETPEQAEQMEEAVA